MLPTKPQRIMATINVYQMVTDRIIAQLEQGVCPWHCPWSKTGENLAISYVSRKPYSFLNQMLLGRNGEYLTFNQVKALGGSVKKGATAGMVVFFKWFEKEKTNADGEKETERIPVLKYYHVFHLSDTTGIESKLQPVECESTLTPSERAEQAISEYLTREDKLRFCNDQPSDRAFYTPALDMVTVPMLSQYEIMEEYYSTTLHEFIHSTGAKHRLDRFKDGKSAAFGSETYSREELIAEIGSAMLCSALGIDNDKAFQNSVAYIKGWSKHLASDPRAIVTASSKAEKAARFFLGIKQEDETA